MKKSICLLVCSITTNIMSFKVTLESQQKLIDFAKTNIIFTRAGTTAFIQNCLNDSLYSRLFLPSCFDHMIDFLTFGKALAQRTEFNIEVLNLFHQELKQTPWINAFAFVRLLDAFPTVIDADNHLITIKERFKKTLYTHIEQKFDDLKSNPDLFLNNLSDDLVTVHAEVNDTQELYAVLLRFLEQACDKLIWSPEDREVTWECFILLGNQLERLQNAGLIPTVKKLNSLYWSLISRYAYFIETSAREIGLPALEVIQQSLAHQAPSWVLLPESESTLRTKKAYLEATLFEADFALRM